MLSVSQSGHIVRDSEGRLEPLFGEVRISNRPNQTIIRYSVQQLVSELSTQVLDDTVIRWRSRLDKLRLRLNQIDLLFPDRCPELRSVVRAEMLWRKMKFNQRQQSLKHPIRPHPSGHARCKRWRVNASIKRSMRKADPT
jgi:hypothetical protein